MKYPKYLGSSIDENSLSLTLKGLIPLVLIVATAYGWNLDEGILSEWVAGLSTAVTALITLYGLTRKIYSAIRIK